MLEPLPRCLGTVPGADPDRRTRGLDRGLPSKTDPLRPRRSRPSGGRQWEGDTISIRGPEARPPKFNEIDFAVAFARIECHYFKNGGFFPEDGWILNNIHQIRHIPGWIVNGRFDVVTPLEAAWKLHKAWPEASFEIVWDAGHASTEPGIIDGLLRATDAALNV
jgi:proline iminopeptidase